MRIAMGGGVEKESNLLSAKEAEIQKAISETRTELSWFEKIVTRVQEFFTNPQEALKNLWKDITWQNKEKPTNSSDGGNPTTDKTPETNNTSHMRLDASKKLENYSDAEAKTLFTNVFGEGLVTNAFMYLTHNSSAAMLRTVALAKHEGNLDFDIKNLDPNKASKQKNYSTFQLSAKNLDEKLAESKVGFRKLLANTPFSRMSDSGFDSIFASLDVRQQNLALWLGHIMSRPRPYEILKDLANPHLSDDQVANLMSKRIQGGIDAIGWGVVKQMKTAKAWDYFSAMRSHGYEPMNVA